jgi:hypothetical protein
MKKERRAKTDGVIPIQKWTMGAWTKKKARLFIRAICSGPAPLPANYSLG